jgi:hypothetical protein
MAVINKNLPVLDRKEWGMMTPAPVTTAAAMFVIPAGSGYPDLSMYITSNTVAYLYSHAEDGWTQIPSPALAGTFGAGACGAYSAWSQTFTATGGSTTTVTVAAATFNLTAAHVVGSTIEFLSAGTATGQRRVVKAVDNRGGAGTITLLLDYAVATAILNTHTFRLSSGRFFVMGAGTTASGSWKAFDVATQTWLASLQTTGLPATNGTDSKCIWSGRPPGVLANGLATAGSTTTLTDSTQNWATNQWAGFYVLTVSGTGAGQCLKILSNTATALTFATASAPDTTTVYQIRGNAALAVGKATSGSATTLVNTGKTWTSGQWVNYQLRIISGTGAGQIKKITASDGTSVTIGSGATLDNTSVYEIEPNEDLIYFAGNNAVTMYTYSISANTWATLSPGVARAAAPTTGMCLDFIGWSEDVQWGNESTIQDGRYIVSLRGSAGAAIDRYDIVGNTWLALTYPGATETFTTGSSAFQSGRFLYIRKDATNRFFKFDLVGNVMLPFNTDLFPDGAALLGQKVWVKNLDQTEQIQWLYALANTGTALRRIGIV